MPFLGNIYLENDLVYLTKFQLVTAVTGNQSYNSKEWFFWWMNTSKTMANKLTVRAFFFDHFSENNVINNWVFSYMQHLYLENDTYKYVIISFVEEYFTREEKRLFVAGIRSKLLQKKYLDCKIYLLRTFKMFNSTKLEK